MAMFLPFQVSRYFCEHKSDLRPIEFIDKYGDLYRLMADDRLYIHWHQDGKVPYAKEGSCLGYFRPLKRAHVRRNQHECIGAPTTRSKETQYQLPTGGYAPEKLYTRWWCIRTCHRSPSQ